MRYGMTLTLKVSVSLTLKPAHERPKQESWGFKNWPKDLPGGAVVKKPPAIAEDMFNPCSRKSPCATGQLSLWAATTEAWVPRAHAPQTEKPQQREEAEPRNERVAPDGHNKRSPHTATETQSRGRKEEGKEKT